MQVERILNAELKVDQRSEELVNEVSFELPNIEQGITKTNLFCPCLKNALHLNLMGGNLTDDNNNSTNAGRHLIECYQIIEWAKEIPHFLQLSLDDQIALLKSGWNELLIAAFSHR